MVHLNLFSSVDDSLDGPSLGSPASPPEFNSEDTIEDDFLTILLLEQQTAWEAATNDVPATDSINKYEYI